LVTDIGDRSALSAGGGRQVHMKEDESSGTGRGVSFGRRRRRQTGAPEVVGRPGVGGENKDE